MRDTHMNKKHENKNYYEISRYFTASRLCPSNNIQVLNNAECELRTSTNGNQSNLNWQFVIFKHNVYFTLKKFMQ